jgi:hypothetical protein
MFLAPMPITILLRRSELVLWVVGYSSARYNGSRITANYISANT